MSRYRIRPVSVGVLARGQDYRIKDLGGTPGGYTQLVEKELGVSLDADSPLTRWTQLHELSHVRHDLWTPGKVARYIKRAHGVDVDPGLVLGAMDARINEKLRRKVPDCMDGYALTPAYLDHMRRDLTGWIACHASPPCRAEAIGPHVDARLKAAVKPWLDKIARAPMAELTILKTVVPLVLAAHKAQQEQQQQGDGQGQEQQQGQSEEQNTPPGQQGQQGQGDEEQQGDGEGSGEEQQEQEQEDEQEQGGDDGDEQEDEQGEDEGPDDGDEDDRKALGKPDAEGHSECGAGGPPPANGQRQHWLIPEIIEIPLTEAHVGGAASWASAESGPVIRWSALHRINTDGVVFRRARKRPGAVQRGTVLIDFSGSIGFSERDLAEMVELLPFATIAVYGGRSRNGGLRDARAHIVIVARNGRRAGSLDFRDFIPGGLGRDNTCDGPALLWLSRQPGPRVWVCDGLVTGDGGTLEPALAEECDAIVRAGAIHQVSWGMGFSSMSRGVRVTRGMVQASMDWDSEDSETFKGALVMLAKGQTVDPGPQKYRGRSI